MIFKNISQTKLSLALISLVITFFVWQQGLRDSLNRPSVSFDISQKEQEIAELSVQSIPVNLKKFFIINDPVDQINKSLSEVSFEELTERNKLIWMISSDLPDFGIDNNFSYEFKNKNYKLLFDDLERKSNNDSYKPNYDLYELFKGDRFLYHLLSKKFDFDASSLITKSLSQRMIVKILAIRLIPLFTMLLGSILVLNILWTCISLKKVAENKSATTVYMNHKDEFFTTNWDGRGKGGTDNLLMEFKDAVCKFETKAAKEGGLTFKSQDARFRVWDDGNTYDFQIKANDSTKFDGLKYEPTSKGASAARLGKATVEWVLDLQRDNGVGRYFSKTNGDYPKNVDEFVENKFAKDHCSCTWKEMIRTIIDGATGTSNKKLEHALTSKPGKTLEEVACDNFELVFDTCLLYTSPSPRDQRGSRMAWCA